MALRALRRRLLATTLTAASIALGVALVVAVLLLEREAREAFRGTALGVEILVTGDKGGRVESLLSALYHVGRAPGRVPWAYYEHLRDGEPYVEYAIPLAYGDRYRGLPIVGTTRAIFTRFEPRPNRTLAVDGDAFGGAPRQAVAGARTGLLVGDTFTPSHSGHAGDPTHRDEVFTVVGVARATGTAHDRVLWVDVEDFLGLRGHDRVEKSVSAVLVKSRTRSPVLLEGLIARINESPHAQALRPVRVVGELFALVGDVQRVLKSIAVLIVVVALLGVMVSIYNTMAARRGEIAVLRALGASRRRVFATILLESALICLLGGAAGLVLAHGGAAWAAPWIEARAGVTLRGAGMHPGEPWILLAMFAAGCTAGLLPAAAAYRIDVARALE